MFTDFIELLKDEEIIKKFKKDKELYGDYYVTEAIRQIYKEEGLEELFKILDKKIKYTLKKFKNEEDVAYCTALKVFLDLLAFKKTSDEDRIEIINRINYLLDEYKEKIEGEK